MSVSRKWPNWVGAQVVWAQCVPFHVTQFLPPTSWGWSALHFLLSVLMHLKKIAAHILSSVHHIQLRKVFLSCGQAWLFPHKEELAHSQQVTDINFLKLDSMQNTDVCIFWFLRFF